MGEFFGGGGGGGTGNAITPITVDTTLTTDVNGAYILKGIIPANILKKNAGAVLISTFGQPTFTTAGAPNINLDLYNSVFNPFTDRSGIDTSSGNLDTGASSPQLVYSCFLYVNGSNAIQLYAAAGFDNGHAALNIGSAGGWGQTANTSAIITAPINFRVSISNLATAAWLDQGSIAFSV